ARSLLTRPAARSLHPPQDGLRPAHRPVVPHHAPSSAARRTHLRRLLRRPPFPPRRHRRPPPYPPHRPRRPHPAPLRPPRPRTLVATTIASPTVPLPIPSCSAAR